MAALLSILLGVYYRRADTTLLERSIQSIQNQNFSDFEFLICDDGSSLQAIEYLNQVARLDSRIRLIRRGNLFTLPEKLNACLAQAEGTLIARMDDDDYSHPNRFVRQIEFLEQNEEISFVGCNVNLVRGGQTINTRVLPEYPTVQDFFFVQPFIHPTLIFRRESLLAVNGYSEEKHRLLCEDYDLLLRLYAAGYRGYNLQEVLLDYTIPPTAKGNRTMQHRWNETVTRYQCFQRLGVLPAAFPYVIKPLVVGLIPEVILRKLKKGL